jgi:hypothetical protein
MSGYEKIQYEELKLRLQKTGLPEVEEKEPVLAGVLNILPGFGNAYLEQWGPFVGNLLFWPLSIVWAVPQAVIDSNIINKKQTLLHYTHGPGKEDLEKAEQKINK